MPVLALNYVVEGPSLETLKAKIDVALSKLMSLLPAQGLDMLTFKSPFQPKTLCDSVTQN